MELSEKMIRFRAKHNLTQTQLAELCSLSKLTIINAERDDVSRITRAKIELKMEEVENGSINISN